MNKIFPSTIKTLAVFFALITTIALSGCGGGSSGGTTVTNTDVSPAHAPQNLAVSADGMKTIRIDWDFTPKANHFIVNEDKFGTDNYVQRADSTYVQDLYHSYEIAVHKERWGTTEYKVDACCEDNSIQLRSDAITLPNALCPAVIGYFKASNTNLGDNLGHSMSLSGDGRTLALGAPREASSATGINGNQADNSAPGAGAVYVFYRSAAGWAQQAYIKASNAQQEDVFGWTVELSNDGNTLAVSAIEDDSPATGINGSQGDHPTLGSAFGAGAVYVFTRTGTTWTQQAYIKASDVGERDNFGKTLAMSADGNTLAVGAMYEDSNATGINGDDTDNSAQDAGAVYLFTRSGTTWSQEAYIKASNTEFFDFFGTSISLSADGNTLAVGAEGEASTATGIGGNQADNLASGAGAVYVFTRSGTTWSQESYIKASNTEMNDYFGAEVALSSDGSTLAVVARYERSSATGIDGDQADNSLGDAGAAYIFARSGSSWVQQAYIKPSAIDISDYFGSSIAINSDGTTLVISATGERSNATNIDGDDTNNSSSDAGAAYHFTRTGTTWSQYSYVKAPNTQSFDWFGFQVDLSDDGLTLAISAREEDSGATGVGGNQGDNSVGGSGAAYLY